MKKTLLCLAALVLIPLLLLTSCGGDKDDVTTPKAPEALSDLSSYTIIYPYEPDTAMYRVCLYILPTEIFINLTTFR